MLRALHRLHRALRTTPRASHANRHFSGKRLPSLNRTIEDDACGAANGGAADAGYMQKCNKVRPFSCCIVAP
jgi:hypothetical protein